MFHFENIIKLGDNKTKISPESFINYLILTNNSPKNIISYINILAINKQEIEIDKLLDNY